MRIIHLLTLLLIISLVFTIIVLDMTHSYRAIGYTLGRAVRPISVSTTFIR